MITLDATTSGEYEAAATAQLRAQAVLNALSGTITVKVYTDADAEVGSGTMTAPWATRSDKTLTVGEVASFAVATSGTPSGWYLRIASATRYVQGTFGLAGDSTDFTWSLPTWEAGQTGSLGTVTLTAAGPEAPAFTVAPATASIAATGGTIQFTATDPNGDTVTYSIVSKWQEDVDINGTTGLVTVPASAQGTSGNVVVRASDGTLTVDATCAVTVASSVRPAADSGTSFDTLALGAISESVNTLTEYGLPIIAQSSADCSADVSATQSYSGGKSMRCFIPANTTGGDTARDRSGISFVGTSHPGMRQSSWDGMEIWCGFAVRLDANWPHPNDGSYPAGGVGYPQAGCSLHTDVAGQSYSGSSITIRAGNGSYRNQWSIASEQAGSEWAAGDFAADRGQWVRWVYRVVYRSTATGVIEIYKNGTRIINATGLITLKAGNTRTPYLKCQVYNDWLETHSGPDFGLYIDEIRWAVGANKYDTVAP